MSYVYILQELCVYNRKTGRCFCNLCAKVILWGMKSGFKKISFCIKCILLLKGKILTKRKSKKKMYTKLFDKITMYISYKFLFCWIFFIWASDWGIWKCICRVCCWCWLNIYVDFIGFQFTRLKAFSIETYFVLRLNHLHEGWNNLHTYIYNIHKHSLCCNTFLISVHKLSSFYKISWQFQNRKDLIYATLFSLVDTYGNRLVYWILRRFQTLQHNSLDQMTESYVRPT